MIWLCLAGKEAQQLTLTQLAQQPKPARAKSQPEPLVQNASSDASAVALVPSVFTERGKQGDFIWETEAAILANNVLINRIGLYIYMSEYTIPPNLTNVES